MNNISNRKCEVCLKKGEERKVRTICDECREFLCKECSDMHLLFKSSANHTLIDLDPPSQDQRSADDSELASDFQETLTVSETTVLYRAQVAVEGGARSSEGKNVTEKRETKAKQDEVDLEKVDVKKDHEFSVSRSDDKKNVRVTGVLTLNDTIIIVDNNNKKLKLFDLSGKFLSSTDTKDSTRGITHVNNDKFATCGISDEVFLWTVRGQTIVSEDESYDVDHYADGIHYNGTYYCVLHRVYHAVTILDRQGRRVRKIVMEEAFGKMIWFGWDIHMDRDKHDIYVPCSFPSPNHGVLCMSVEGEALWFTPLNDAYPRGITEIHGALCIASYACLHLISKTGQYMKKLPEKKKLDGEPQYIYYDERDHKLYVSRTLFNDKKDIICVYSLQ